MKTIYIIFQSQWSSILTFSRQTEKDQKLLISEYETNRGIKTSILSIYFSDIRHQLQPFYSWKPNITMIYCNFLLEIATQYFMFIVEPPSAIVTNQLIQDKINWLVESWSWCLGNKTVKWHILHITEQIKEKKLDTQKMQQLVTNTWARHFSWCTQQI